ncbi:restriction endonuclease subunit S [Aeromonas caviae]|uniref:restriction endonuclease subunit S n=1 Tax=Aeromonas caviae TaxID=648 RepID=UPI001FBBC715|nr:restriction endonuclease subunit S [Aeromonas caviae]GKR10396.1 restriction endonuclease [Aeromonas caviae]
MVRHQCKEGDLVFPKVGTIGKVGILSTAKGIEHYLLSTNTMRLRVNDKVACRDFVYYYFAWPRTSDSIKAHNANSVQPVFNFTSLKNFEITLPPLEEQRCASAFLCALDDRIALLRETSATLEAIAQALFKSWFVDFDPVHARTREEQPAGLAPEVAALFPDSFEESPLGLVPRGWSLSQLSEAYEINPTRKLKKGEMAPYLDMASVATSGHTVAGVSDREMGSGTKFINGDTLLARITPCLENGKTAFVDFLSQEQTGWGSTEFVVLRPKAPLPAYHGYLLARHPAFREHAIQSMSGTSGRQRVQNDVLGRYLVIVPSEKVAMAFNDVISPLQQKITENHRQAQTLANLRDTLLPRLITGQLRLPDAEAMVAEAQA